MRRALPVLCGLIAAWPAFALGQTPVHDSVHTTLATITTDTGDFAAGPRTFVKFTHPDLCVQEMRRRVRLDQRTVAAQRAREERLAIIADAGDTPDSIAIRQLDAARRCGANFTVAGTTPESLPDLFRVAAYAWDDTLALAVVKRWLSVTSTDSARESAIRTMVAVFDTTQPTRAAAAEALVAMLEHAPTPGMSALTPVARVHWSAARLTRAVALGDESAIGTLATTLVTQAQQLSVPQRTRLAPTLVTAYQRLGQLAWSHGALDSVDALGRAAEVALSPLPGVMRHVFWYGALPNGTYATPAEQAFVAKHDSAAAAYLHDLNLDDVRHSGRLQAPHWAPHPPDANALMLVLSPELYNFGGPPDVGGFNRPILSAFYGVYEENIYYAPGPDSRAALSYVVRIRRWLAQAKATGRPLAIVLAMHSHGDVLGRGTLTPAQEIERVRWFFQEYNGLPVTIAMAPESMMPGRTVDDVTAVGEKHYPYLMNSVSLIDPSGTVLYSGWGGPGFELVLSKALRGDGN